MAVGKRVHVDQQSLRRVLAKIEAKSQEMKRKAAAFLYQRAQYVMTESKREVPVKTGALASSGFVEQPDVSRGSISVTMGYGGPAREYAIPVHEDLTARHTEGRKAKYLEDPVRRAVPGLARDLANAIKL